MKVMKFGGTSVGSPQRIKEVASLITRDVRNLVVLSAMSGTTNSLLEISDAAKKEDKTEANGLIDRLEAKYNAVIDELYEKQDNQEEASRIVKRIFKDIHDEVEMPYSEATEKNIVACGELISTNLMHQLLLEQGYKAVLLPALDFMRTDEHSEPDHKYIAEHLNPMIENNPDAYIFITQGFICRNANGDVDNLLRGGSDYTASIVGAAVNADEVQIWTDIDGMHNNDPRFVEGTKPVHNLHFEEAAELAYFGAKILHPTCILPAKLKNIPVKLLNTMEPDADGTVIDNKLIEKTIKAVAAKDGITAIKIKSDRMLLAYGFLKKVFEVFEKYETPIDMITTSEVGVSLTIDNTTHLQPILEELKHYGTVSVDPDMVIICVVGDLKWENKGFEAEALDALHEIPVRMISYGGSNYNISFLIRKEDKVKALNALSARLFS